MTRVDSPIDIRYKCMHIAVNKSNQPTNLRMRINCGAKYFPCGLLIPTKIREMKKRSPENKKKRKTTRVRSSHSRLLHNVVDYLMSDTYMFSPLLASPNSSPRFLASQLGSSSTSGLGVQLKLKRRSTKLVQVVRDYLTSDSHMYGPLVASHPVASPNGHTHYAKKTSVEISKTKFSTKDNRTIIESSNTTVEDRVSEDELPEDGIVGSQKKSVRQEMVKRTVYYKCRSSSVPGAVGSKLRALVVE